MDFKKQQEKRVNTLLFKVFCVETKQSKNKKRDETVITKCFKKFRVISIENACIM